MVQKHGPSWSLIWTHWRLHIRCQWQILNIYWWAHISNVGLCQRSGLLTINWWHLTSSFYLHLAMLHTWTQKYQHTMLCTWGRYLQRQKANGQLENTTGLPSRLAQQCPGGCQCYTAVNAEENWDCQGSWSGEWSTRTMQLWWGWWYYSM